MQRDDGSRCENAEDLRGEIQNFYTDLYTTERAPDFDGLLHLVQHKVSQEDQVMLGGEFTDEEFKRALFQMHPSKAPEVDGFTAGFYQRHWDLIGPSLCEAVRGFLNGGEMPMSLNDTAHSYS